MGHADLGWDPGAAQALVQAAHFFHARGWCPATSSNFSFRAADGEGCWISESGIDKGELGPQHLMAVDFEGQPRRQENRRPSAETLLHTMVYRSDPGAQAVFHVHAPFSVVMSRADASLGSIQLEGWELQKGLAGVRSHSTELTLPIFPNSQDIGALSQEIQPKLSGQTHLCAFLLAGHGLYAYGGSLAEAKRHVEVVESLLEQLYLWRTLR